MQEFGTTIPWLRTLPPTIEEGLNPADILNKLGLSEDEFAAYQLRENDEYIGGIILFSRSPERFIDPKNASEAERLASSRSGFITCLQISPEKRKQGYGSMLMRQAVPTILEEYGSVWGVISNPSLIPWYRSLGGKILSLGENHDKLWIVSWEK